MQLAERENAASRKVQPFISSFVWLASSHRFLLSIGQSGAINAALFAAAILGLTDTGAAQALDGWRQAQAEGVAERPAAQQC